MLVVEAMGPDTSTTIECRESTSLQFPASFILDHFSASPALMYLRICSPLFGVSISCLSVASLYRYDVSYIAVNDKTKFSAEGYSSTGKTGDAYITL